MRRLLAVRAVPHLREVLIADATWQDHPEWGDDRWVTFRSSGLVHPDRPPFPGFAVAARAEGPYGPRAVDVEVWSVVPWPDSPAYGLRRVHKNTLAVGIGGVIVADAHLALPEGRYPIQIWVDAEDPSRLGRVAFLLANVPAGFTPPTDDGAGPSPTGRGGGRSRHEKRAAPRPPRERRR